MNPDNAELYDLALADLFEESQEVEEKPSKSEQFGENIEEKYAAYMRRLIIGMRKKLNKMTSENLKLKENLKNALDSSGVVVCPNCNHYFKERYHNLRPLNMKIFRASKCLEIEFRSAEDLNSWLYLNQLETNSDGIPTILKNEKAESGIDTLKSVGSIIVNNLDKNELGEGSRKRKIEEQSEVKKCTENKRIKESNENRSQNSKRDISSRNSIENNKKLSDRLKLVSRQGKQEGIIGKDSCLNRRIRTVNVDQLNERRFEKKEENKVKEHRSSMKDYLHHKVVSRNEKNVERIVSRLSPSPKNEYLKQNQKSRKIDVSPKKEKPRRVPIVYDVEEEEQKIEEKVTNEWKIPKKIERKPISVTSVEKSTIIDRITWKSKEKNDEIIDAKKDGIDLKNQETGGSEERKGENVPNYEEKESKSEMPMSTNEVRIAIENLSKIPLESDLFHEFFPDLDKTKIFKRDDEKEDDMSFWLDGEGEVESVGSGEEVEDLRNDEDGYEDQDDVNGCEISDIKDFGEPRETKIDVWNDEEELDWGFDDDEVFRSQLDENNEKYSIPVSKEDDEYEIENIPGDAEVEEGEIMSESEEDENKGIQEDSRVVSIEERLTRVESNDSRKTYQDLRARGKRIGEKLAETYISGTSESSSRKKSTENRNEGKKVDEGEKIGVRHRKTFLTRRNYNFP